jgi:hypothetical protein
VRVAADRAAGVSVVEKLRAAWVNEAPPRSFDSAPQALFHRIHLWGAPLRMTILWGGGIQLVEYAENTKRSKKLQALRTTILLGFDEKTSRTSLRFCRSLMKNILDKFTILLGFDEKTSRTSLRFCRGLMKKHPGQVCVFVGGLMKKHPGQVCVFVGVWWKNILDRIAFL